MVARGHVVHVAVPDVTEDLRGKVAELGATLHEVRLSRTGLNPVADLRYCFALYRLIKRLRVERVIGYTAKPNIWGSLAAGMARVPSASMVTGLGYAFIEGEGAKRRLIQGALRFLYSAATRANDRVVFQNPDDRDDFIATGCLTDPAKAVLVNGSGIDTEHFAAAPLPEAPVFLMVARLLVAKGTREYIAAAAVIAAERPDCRFLLAGFLDEGHDGIGAEELERAQDAGIVYLGKLDDVRPAIAGASVYVLPSYREGTPRTVLEAMAMGRAVITTDVPGCRETVQPGVNGLLVPARQVEPLADAIRLLADQPALRRSLGKEGRRIAEEKYAIAGVNAETLRPLGL